MKSIQIANFWMKVSKDGPRISRLRGKCWIFHGCKRDGYGLSAGMNAHRISWIFLNGRIPFGMLVLHKCDNRLCVNPSHLFLGTIQDNMDDRNRKFRQAYGEYSGKATITEKQARYILSKKSNGRTPRGYLKTLSAKMKIDPQTISNIWRGKTWRHL